MATRLLIIDMMSLFYRAHYAGVGTGRRGENGVPAWATDPFKGYVYGAIDQAKPTHVVVASEDPGRGFRHEIFSDYKAGRFQRPVEIDQQLPAAASFLLGLGIKTLKTEGAEADDVIASLVAKLGNDTDITIASSDKDLQALIGGRVNLIRLKNAGHWDRVDVESFSVAYGFPPALFSDYLSITGDNADNISGAPGIGEKGASALITAFGSLPGATAAARQLAEGKPSESLKTHERLLKKLAASLSEVELSKRLVELKADLEFEARLEDLLFTDQRPKAAKKGPGRSLLDLLSD